MEVRDGFIVGIFNYCDRWCEVCPFTSRCRLFADVAESEASLDPELVERGVATHREAAPFIEDLVWREAIERIFPSARAFVRPAFDEPDEIAKLLAQERA